MTRSEPTFTFARKSAGSRWASLLTAGSCALVVAGGARVAFFLGGTMMAHVGFVGAWLMLTLGLAYAAVRLRPKVGGALLVGFGVGTVLVIIFGGMQMIT